MDPWRPWTKEAIDMPLPKMSDDVCTAEDYWNLPDGQRAELIDGVLYDMAPPSWAHQLIAAGLTTDLTMHVRAHGGPCRVVAAPVAVNLNADDSTWVEPDVLVVCDPAKLSNRACEGAPDLVVEVVSSSSIRMDYFTKAARYEQAGVREYWIVDPLTEQVVVYPFVFEGPRVRTFTFADAIPVGIFEGLTLTIASYL